MEIYEFLKNVFLFDNMKKTVVDKALSIITPVVEKYSKKDVICSPAKYDQRIGFIKSGECKVERAKLDGATVPLNIIKEYGSFGVISVFSDVEEFPTKITASKDTEIVYISKEDSIKLIRNYHEISLNVIKFISKKIVFLNKKLATFTEDSVENKLSSFLYESYVKFGAEFAFNCKRSADSISVGRASLYRAIAALTGEGIIKLENKKIYIIDPKGLERKTK